MTCKSALPPRGRQRPTHGWSVTDWALLASSGPFICSVVISNSTHTFSLPHRYLRTFTQNSIFTKRSLHASRLPHLKWPLSRLTGQLSRCGPSSKGDSLHLSRGCSVLGPGIVSTLFFTVVHATFRSSLRKGCGYHTFWNPEQQKISFTLSCSLVEKLCNFPLELLIK